VTQYVSLLLYASIAVSKSYPTIPYFAVLLMYQCTIVVTIHTYCAADGMWNGGMTYL